MKSFTLFLILIIGFVTIVVAEQESKFQEIIQLLNSNNQHNHQEHQQLKAEAQTYSASVADPDSSYSQGYSRDRSRYTSSQPVSNNQALDEEEKRKLEEEEEEKKPDRLALLLAESKFSCQDLKNGYYADESVGCQIFHYCIDGVKHSWQCPENTVFHQIHLNCVPNTQDICQQSSKYHIVNEYLHKELDERGPNNTVLYHQRFYPDGFDYSGGDPVAQIFQAQAQAALQKAQQARRQPQPQPIEEDEEEEPVPRPRTRSRQQYLSSPQSQPLVRSQPQAVRNENKPLYRQQIGRPLVSYQPPPQPPPPQPKPTSRPISYTTQPETFAPPTYTESPQEDFNSNDYSRTSSDTATASIQSVFQPSNSLPPSSFNIPSSNSFSQPSSSSSSQFQPSGGATNSFTSSGSNSGYTSSGSSNSFQPSSASSFSPSSSSQSGGGFRTPSRTSGYPTHRSLGIPIASFRVAPASSFVPSSSQASSQQTAASSIQEVNVAPLISFTSLSNNHDENQQLMSQLFY